MFVKTFTIMWALFVAATFALPSSIASLQTAQRDDGYSSIPLPPSQDPFYTAPLGFEHTPPGTILRLRPAPGNLTSIVANCSAAYNILYRTTSSLYTPTYALKTLFIPSYPSNDTHAPLLSYMFPYNSVDINSSPSYSIYSSPLPDIAPALGLGWFVSVPDYEGPLAANAAGIIEAHSTLDSLRAILSSHLVPADPRIALWGYSGGSIPSEWALEFQEQYAPELSIAGAALGGLVPNSTDVFDSVGGTIWASHAISGILGAVVQYPDAYAYLLSQLKTEGPFNKTGFLAIQNMSYTEAHMAYANQSMFDYFVNGAEILQAKPVREVLQVNGVMTYHGVPKPPLFVYKAIHDEVTVVGDTDAYVKRNCAFGAKIKYERNTIGGHVDELTNGDARALGWLATLFKGGYDPEGCTVQNVTVGIVDTGL